MKFFNLLKKSSRKRKSVADAFRFNPRLEGLETRLVPYSVSGNAWPNPGLITLSFMPDGTNLGSVNSNLFSTFNTKFGSAATWQNVILKAAQQWAQQTNINFAVVSDNGAASGAGLYQQGDPGMGDIRIGGYNFQSSTLAQAYMPPPVNNYSIAGDISFNTDQPFNINGQSYDLYTVAMHEFGHALGLLHSATISAAQYSNYTGVKNGLTSDDIAGIRNVYSNNNPRSTDQYGALNNSFTTAANINASINSSNWTAQVTSLDVTTAGQKDYFTVTAPTTTGSTVAISVQSQGLSLLAPTLTVYDNNQHQIGYASGSGHYGTTVTLNLTNVVTPGEQLYVKVAGADNTALGTGKYALTMSFAGATLPTVPLPNTQVLNGTPLSGGGGQANADVLQFTAAASFNAQLNSQAQQAVATDPNGNYVVVWSSYGTDGDGWGVYAQRYDLNGNLYGPTTKVNTTTAGDQTYAAVAMSANGTFVVTWSSYNQDGSGWGVYAQRFNANWRKDGGEFQVNTTTTGDQMYSSVAMDANGNFIITWSSNQYDGTGWNVEAQRFDATGAPVGGEFQVNTYTGGDNLYSKVAMDDAGDAVITWSSYGQDGDGWGVYAQRYDANGVAQSGSDIPVNTYTAGDQAYPSVAMTASGSFVITWSSFGQDGQGWGVFAQEFDATGTPLSGQDMPVNTTTAGDQMYSSVAVDPNGDFIITWQSNDGGQNGTKSVQVINAAPLNLNSFGSSAKVVPGKDNPGNAWNIYAQQFDVSGALVGNEFRVNTTTLGAQQFASVGWDRMGHIVVAWSSNGILLGLGAGVYGQRYVVGADNLDAPETGAPETSNDIPAGLRLADFTGRVTSTFSGLSAQSNLVNVTDLENLLNLGDDAPAHHPRDDFFAAAAAALNPLEADIFSPMDADNGLSTPLDSDAVGSTPGEVLAS